MPVVFERVTSEPDEQLRMREEMSPQFQAQIASMLPKGTDPFVVDAYLMFQVKLMYAKDVRGSFPCKFGHLF